ncbi:hypothetical protein SAMN05444920_12465 [Nonomuraea solani]|uniref:DUF3562 domain-containing protein n=1 Tax=Nonomuraea solani TaxID=1144553 RepID=A0A1H6EW58_9ACTN|nr:hypothetical protein [Nonomuraea solani]SEH02130.1 hypothetical protein SAMN05444920_12465 [Nonomuraea solani]
MAGEASEVFEKQARAQIRAELTSAYGADCTPEQVLEAIDRAWSRFDQVPVREFVPLLAARFAREELRRLMAGPPAPDSA